MQCVRTVKFARQFSMKTLSWKIVLLPCIHIIVRFLWDRRAKLRWHKFSPPAYHILPRRRCRKMMKIHNQESGGRNLWSLEISLLHLHTNLTDAGIYLKNSMKRGEWKVFQFSYLRIENHDDRQHQWEELDLLKEANLNIPRIFSRNHAECCWLSARCWELKLKIELEWCVLSEKLKFLWGCCLRRS